MPYLHKQMSREEVGVGGSISFKQRDYYYIQKKEAFTAPLYRTTSESDKQIQARLKWKKIELFNEYNKIDFSPKVKE